MLALRNASKTYPIKDGNPVFAVREASLHVRRGDFLVITGRSGSGKTTLLNLAAGLTRPTTGGVLLNGTSLWDLPDRQQSHLRNQKIGFIFQFPSLLPSLTVLENVVLPTTFGRDPAQDRASARASQLLKIVGLADKLHVYPRQLSAGQQQRVVVARSLINQPEVLLADEPTSNLDEQTEHEILDLFREIHATTGITVLMVTHSSGLARYGNRALHMAGGVLRETGEGRGDHPA